MLLDEVLERLGRSERNRVMRGHGHILSRPHVAALALCTGSFLERSEARYRHRALTGNASADDFRELSECRLETCLAHACCR